jgi:ribose 5-phosphate isomerase B
MKVAVGSDHRGFSLKQRVLRTLKEKSHEPIDSGTYSEEGVDYPDIAARVCHEVTSGQAQRGILICGTGLGMAIAANKFHGIRAACVHDDVTAELSRRHNDANIVCLSADLLGERLVDMIVDIFLKTDFEGGRHARRLEKVTAIEKAGS